MLQNQNDLADLAQVGSSFHKHSFGTAYRKSGHRSEGYLTAFQSMTGNA
jgi:hypothetical protein